MPTTTHAIVLGASMAGLAVTATLASRFDRVTVIERDELPDGIAQRRGVPQGRHVHAILPGGLAALERTLPGLTGDLLAAGALRLEFARHLRAHLDGGWLAPPTGTDAFFVSASRPLIEGTVRRRCLDLPDVITRTGCDVRGLVAASTGEVTGVRVLPRRPDSSEEVITADLVVDATGRGSRVRRWLADLGYPTPEVERVEVGVRYTTRLYRRRPGDLDGCGDLVVSAVPAGRGADAQAIDGDRWIVTLVGYHGQTAPADPDGFLAFARSLEVPHVADLVERADTLGEGATASFPASQRVRFDRLARFPERLAVVGDAVCSFNPTYGQGMSVAALEAEHLGDELDTGGLDQIGRRAFARSRPTVDAAWDLAVSNDLRLPATVGQRSRVQRLVDRYGLRVGQVAQRDTRVSDAYLRVIGMLEDPSSLLRPSVAWRVLRPGATSAPAFTSSIAISRPHAPTG
jgi:2-polyprenyl-6-methoxyphenol hydroxylase-like FAD-dependent oxidoreductase